MTFVLRGQNAKIGAHILCENKVNVTTTENSASNRKEWFSLNRRATPPAKAGIRPVLQTLLHHIYISSAPYPTIFEELRRRASKLGYVSCKWYISSSVSDILYKKKGMSMERIFPPPPPNLHSILLANLRPFLRLTSKGSPATYTPVQYTTALRLMC